MFNIGRDALVRGSEGALKEEIEKCDVVCANCHRIRTHRREVEPGRQDSNLARLLTGAGYPAEGQLGSDHKPKEPGRDGSNGV